MGLYAGNGNTLAKSCASSASNDENPTHTSLLRSIERWSIATLSFTGEGSPVIFDSKMPNFSIGSGFRYDFVSKSGLLCGLQATGFFGWASEKSNTMPITLGARADFHLGYAYRFKNDAIVSKLSLSAGIGCDAGAYFMNGFKVSTVDDVHSASWISQVVTDVPVRLGVDFGGVELGFTYRVPVHYYSNGEIGDKLKGMPFEISICISK